jgi:uncharacterized phage protein (TIGR01671 family)
MMREIKFRGWHTTQKEMFSAEEMAADQLALLPTGQFINVSGDSTILSEIYPRDKFIPLQYTGLKDRNGKEIYEGDIVRITIAGFGIEKDIAIKWEDGKYTEPMFEDYHREVIGNIYEDPELLGSTGTDA